jgi:hypothetical protein
VAVCRRWAKRKLTQMFFKRPIIRHENCPFFTLRNF